MTIYAKTTPVGIDYEILKWQNLLDGCLDGDVDIYGRLYINERKEKKIAEAFVSNGEYKEVFIEDTKAAVIAFLVNDTRDGLIMTKCRVEIICSCNLDKMYGTNERSDEETLLKILDIVNDNTLLPNQKQIKTGLSNVFSGISFDRFKYRDMQPWFNFSISFDLIYNNF